ncbi:MAG: PKD domain-containing protein [Eubacterium sp.]|nr:PKD domain-containing protein [Eubacterium sp.]
MAILFLPWSSFIYAEQQSYNNVDTYGNFSLNSDVDVNNFILTGYSTSYGKLELNGHSLRVHGKMRLNKVSISFDGGEIICDNDATIITSRLQMSDVNEKISVNGNLDLTVNSAFSYDVGAKLEVKGNFSLKGKVKFKDSTLKLSGDKGQILYQDDECSLSKVIVENYSDEGIIISNAFNYDSLVDNGCKIRFVDETRIVGAKQLEDKVYPGDLYISSGTFDLNGHNIVVMGNLIQEGGTIYLNGGSLKIGGDYRIQKEVIDADEQGVLYTKSSGVYLSDNENDRLSVGGSLYINSSAKNTIVLGTEIDDINNNLYVYSPVEISSEFDGTIIDESAGDEHNSVTDNEEIISTSGDAIADTTIDRESKIFSVKGNIVVGGKLKFSGFLWCGGNMMADSDKQNYLPAVELSSGNIDIMGDVNNVTFNMKQDKDTVLIENDYLINVSDGSESGSDKYGTNGTEMLMSDGEISVKGNLDTTVFNASGNHKLIMSGEDVQYINNAAKLSLATLYLDNHSEEGVVADSTIRKNSIVRNGCKITYQGINGETGWTLEGDEVYDGNLVLIDDTLDLNGHKLTVNGDLIQTVGDIVINGGHLIINGDYRQQSIAGDGYSTSSARLIMKNASDKVDVNGSIYLASTSDNSGNLTSGTLSVSGDIVVDDKINAKSFKPTDDFKMIICGADDQHIQSKTEINIPVLELQNKGNVIADKDIIVSKELISSIDNSYSGTIQLRQNTKLTGTGFAGNIGINNSSYSFKNGIIDKYIIGGDIFSIKHGQYESITFDVPVIINGSVDIDTCIYVNADLTINGNLVAHGDSYYFNNHFIRINQNVTMKVSGDFNDGESRLEMLDGSVLEINGDVKFYNTENKLDDGIIIIHGDASFCNNYRVNEKNIMVFAGDSLQTLNIGSNVSLATVEIDNHSEDGVVATATFYKDELITNGCRFSYEGIEGSIGHKLTQDETIEGDYILIDGELDLNGHTLTIEGNLIHSSGTIDINNGSLIVTGDYRQQNRKAKTGSDEYAYSSGTAVLIMDDENDLFDISGNLFVGTSLSDGNRLSSGNIRVGHDVILATGSNKTAFVAEDSLMFTFYGNNDHSIRYESGSYSNRFELTGFTVESDDNSKITVNGRVTSTGMVDVGETVFESELCIGDAERSTILKGTVINADIKASGKVTFIGVEEVFGNVSGTIDFDSDFTIHGNASIKINGLDEDQVLAVDGYLELSDTNMINGKIIAKGNVDINSDVSFSDKSELILAGDKYQTISCYPKLNRLVLENHSDEGIYCSTLLKCNEFENNGCVIKFKYGEVIEAQRLEKDMTIDGDAVFNDGELDLNGHTLTIKGTFRHPSGTVYFNGGKLIVEKDFYEESLTHYMTGRGSLIMNDVSDAIEVGGLFYINDKTAPNLNKGTIVLAGDFYLEGTSKSSVVLGDDLKVVFTGEKKQTVTFYRATTSNLIFNNKGTVTLENNAKATGLIEDNTDITGGRISGTLILDSLSSLKDRYYSGDISLNTNDELTGDVMIEGKLTIGGGFTFGGHTLTVDSAEIGSKAAFVMTDEKDCFIVKNDLIINALSNNAVRDISAGTIDIYGDLEIKGEKGFTASGTNHVVMHSRVENGRRFITKITMSDSSTRVSKLNTLVLYGTEDDFYFSCNKDTAANEIIYMHAPIELQAVTNLNVTELTDSSVTIAFDDPNLEALSEQNGEAIIKGYEIYRNDVKIATVSKTTFTDRSIKLNSTYRYTVYAVDVYGGVSPESDTLTVNTEGDTTAPSAPSNLMLVGRAGSSITLEWSQSHDDCSIKGYNIYRDGNLVAENIRYTRYRDTGLDQNTIYEYYVKAVDSSDNISEASDTINASVAYPKIKAITPKDYSLLGPEKVTFTAKYVNYGDEAESILTIEYFDGALGEWKKLGKNNPRVISKNNFEIESGVTYDAGLFTDSDVRVRFILTDCDGNTDIYETEYAVDSVAPTALENVTAESVSGVVKLTWDISADADLAYYDVWRCVDEQYVSSVEGSSAKRENVTITIDQLEQKYVRIARINDRYEPEYLDSELREGATAKYIITATDTKGNRSSFENPVQVMVDADNSEPVVLSVIPGTGKVSGKVSLKITVADNKNIDYVAVFAKKIADDENDSTSDNPELYEWFILDTYDTDLKYDKESSKENGWQQYDYTAMVDISALPDGDYIFNFSAVDQSEKHSSALFTRRYTVDNTGIEKIQINRVLNNATAVQLMWKDVNDDDFSSFVIEKAEYKFAGSLTGRTVTTDDGSYKVIDSTYNFEWKEAGRSTSLGYTVTSLVPDSNYLMRVCGMDDAGNKGEYSDIILVRTDKDTLGPVIKAVYPATPVVSDSIELGTRVLDNYMVRNLLWSYSLDGENYTTFVGLGGNGTGDFDGRYTVDISDREQFPEGDIYIKFEAFDYYGNHNQLLDGDKEVINKYRIDRTAPEKPEGVRTENGEGYINILWDVPATDDKYDSTEDPRDNNSVTEDSSTGNSLDEASEDNDIAEYIIYRAEGDTGRFRNIYSGAVSNYVDTDIKVGRTYAYKVSAMDMAGNESVCSEIVYGCADKDDIAPEIRGISPQNRSAVGSDFKLTCIATDNSKLDHLRIYFKYAADDTWTLLGEKECKDEGNNTSGVFDETEVNLEGGKEGLYNFRFVVSDSYGNSSTVERDYILDNTPLDGMISAKTENFAVKLSMTYETNRDSGICDLFGIPVDDFDHYEIYRCKVIDAANTSMFKEKAVMIGRTTEQTYLDETAIPHEMYRYAAKIFDTAGNYSWTDIVTCYADDVDEIDPTVVFPEKYTALSGISVRLDGSLCTDNVHIKSFSWDMGDGTTATGVRPEHIYQEPGEYTVTLTVTDTSGNSSTGTTIVEVKSAETSGICSIKVVDENNNPIPYAYVYINAGNDRNTVFYTDDAGEIKLAYGKGRYQIAAYKDGYLPAEDEVKIKPLKTTVCRLKLKKGEVVVGDFKVHKMTVQEMVDAGVDMSDPENLNIFTFTTTMTFAQSPIPVVVTYVGGDPIITQGKDTIIPGGAGTEDEKDKNNGGGMTDGRNNNPPKIMVAQADPELPVFVMLSTKQQISWLKDMYCAELTILNAADTQFVLEDSIGTIKLPDGLSLAKTINGQTEVIDMGNIAGQEQKTASWVVKGDENGTYKLEAVFNGRLMPFGADIEKRFLAETEINVSPADVEIIISPENAGYIGEIYYVQFSITNNGREPLYNFTTSLGEYESPAHLEITLRHDDELDENVLVDKHFEGITYKRPISEQIYQTPVLSGGDTIVIPTLMPGQTIYGTWKSGFAGPGDPEEVYYQLVDTMVKVIEGENLGVKVYVRPIESHITALVKQTVELESIEYHIGDPVDMKSGAFTENYTAMSLMGRDNLALMLSYDSLLAQSVADNEQSDKTANDTEASSPESIRANCPEGAGWYSNFDSYITEDDGIVHLHLNPYISMPFISSDSMNGIICGTYQVDDEDAEITFDEEGTIDKDVEFSCIYHGMEDFRLVRHFDGTYSLISEAGGSFEYDTEGRLSRIITSDGSVTTFEYSEDKTVVTELVSGNSITLGYTEVNIKDASDIAATDGADVTEERTVRHLTSVSDNNGRKTEFIYDDDQNLISIKESNGSSTSFEYDEKHHITAEYNSNGEAFISNSYDDKGRVVKQTDSYGKTISFSYDEASEAAALKVKAVTSAEGYDDTTTETWTDLKGNIIKLISASGAEESYTYDEAGNLISRTDSYGNLYRYAYDSEGRLIGSSGPVGNNFAITYDDRGNVTSIKGTGTEADSNKDAYYIYNDKDQLIESLIGSRKTLYTYTEEGLLSTEEKVGKGTVSYTYENGRKVSSTDELGNVTKYDYDTCGNLIKVTDAAGNSYQFSYDSLNRKISSTDPNGNITRYEYNDYNKVTKEIYPDGTSVSYTYNVAGNLIKATYPNGTYTSFNYDAAGNMVTETMPDGTANKYEYNALGQNTAIVYPDGSRENYAYDITGNLISSTDRKGNEINYVYDHTLEKIVGITDCYGQNMDFGYDNEGSIVSVTTPGSGETAYTYTSDDMISSVTDVLGNKTIYEHDIWGNMLSSTDPNGNKTLYKYDAVGNCIEKTNAESTIFTYTYDHNYNLTSLSTTVSGKRISERYEYDGCGNLIKLTDVMGRETLYTYDCMNRINRIDSYDGNFVEYTYDDMGNLSSETYSDGSSVSYRYDDCSRCVEMTVTGRKGDTGVNNADTKISEDNGKSTKTTTTSLDVIKTKVYGYTYDNMSRITSTTDAADNTTSVTYDALDNITSVTDAMGGVTKYTYDKASRLIRIENAIGSVKLYDYYDNGSLKKITNGRGQETVYTYDALGRLESVTDEIGTINYTYDKNGNVISVSEKNKATGKTETITRTYDTMNRVSSVTDVYGRTVNYGYDELGNILYIDYPGGEKVRYTYNVDGTLYDVTDTEGNRTVYSYDGNSRLTKTVKPDGSVEEKTYDKSGNVAAIIEKTADGRLLQHYEYTYDEFGNISKIVDNASDYEVDYSAEADGLDAEKVEDVIEETDVSDDQKESDNASGTDDSTTTTTIKTTTQTTVTTTIEYNAANQLIKYNGNDVLYDADGNMIYGPLNGAMTKFTYDCRNRLISAGDVSYKYDAENVRVAVTADAYEEQYVTDRVSSLSRTLQIIRYDRSSKREEDREKGDPSGDNSDVRNYYYGYGLIYERTVDNRDDNNKPAADNLLVYHFDHQGSTKRITDKTGKLLYSFSYGTYGELLSIRRGEKAEEELTHSALIADNLFGSSIHFLFNGALGVVTDKNSLYYMRQRYYNTDIKRFINQDILTGTITDSQSLNRYSYVQGNPVNYNDPFGLSPMKILTPYINFVHDALNLVSVIPGPIGYVADAISAGMYYLEGKEKAALKMLVMAGNNIATGGLIGKLSSLGSKGRLLASSFFIGTGAKGMALSGASFVDNFMGLIDSISNGDDILTIFHYASGTVCDAAGMYYGAKAFAGGTEGAAAALEDIGRQKQYIGQTKVVNDPGEYDERFNYNEPIGFENNTAGGCFVAGTIVKTPEGDKNIEDVETGDVVYACNGETGDVEEKRVVRAFVHDAYDLIYVSVGNDDICATLNHPFYVVGKGFIPAGDLEIGDIVVLIDGKLARVKQLDIKHLDEPVKVYNFEVEDYHTYYVGTDGVLVHNMCAVTPPTEGGSESVLPPNTKPDFIVTPEGTVMDTSKNYNLVGSGEQGDWFQIHNYGKPEDGFGFPHTHKPQLNTNGTNTSYKRVVSNTTAADIDYADELLRTGKMTFRKKGRR